MLVKKCLESISGGGYTLEIVLGIFCLRNDMDIFSFAKNFLSRNFLAQLFLVSLKFIYIVSSFARKVDAERFHQKGK